jgi:hypothetical protein
MVIWNMVTPSIQTIFDGKLYLKPTLVNKQRPETSHYDVSGLSSFHMDFYFKEWTSCSLYSKCTSLSFLMI